MIPELGQLALALALTMALVQALFPIWGSLNNTPAWMAMARPLAWGQFFFLTMAFSCLIISFLTNDFSVSYVAQNSNTQLPTVYKISAVWGAHEGSMLLWVLFLSAWGAAVATLGYQLAPVMMVRLLTMLGIVSVGFLLFIIFTSNPFERLFPIPEEGRDLNPLLQDPGLAMHPPMLYMGYVGLSVAWSAAIAALIGGQLDANWARWSRPWTLVAWVFLTIGVTLGSWWAYYELGWGGWWFWDPVENASLMPWLVSTALIHSLAVTEKRGAFKNWTVLLALCAFSLSLLGTFLVRSGVLTSVHAFATDPTRGLFILIFLCLVVGGSLALYAWRAPNIPVGGRFDLISRETFLLGNNLLLTTLAAIVLFGTLAPLIYDAMNWGKISVGFPWFNTMFVALTPMLAILMGIGPLAKWKYSQLGELFYRLTFPIVASMVIGIATIWQAVPLYVSLGLTLATWIFAANLTIMWIRYNKVATQTTPFTLAYDSNTTAKIKDESPAKLTMLFRLLQNLITLVSDLTSKGRSFLGLWLAHLGIAIFVIGITMVSHYSIEQDLRMAPGEYHDVAGYRFIFLGVNSQNGPNYQAQRGQFRVLQGQQDIATLAPEKRIYQGGGMPMTEAAIYPTLTHDLYVSLGDPMVTGGAWSVRIHYKPYVRWIWLGGLFMALGGLIAASDQRYRLRRIAATKLIQNT